MLRVPPFRRRPAPGVLLRRMLLRSARDARVIEVSVHDFRGKARVPEGVGGGLRVPAASEDEADGQRGVLGCHGTYTIVGVGGQPDHGVDGRFGVEPHQPSFLRIRVVGEASSSRARCSAVTAPFPVNTARSLWSGCVTTASTTSSGRGRQAIASHAAFASQHSSLVSTSAGAAGFHAIASRMSR